MKRLVCLLVAVMACVGSVFAADVDDDGYLFLNIPVTFVDSEASLYSFPDGEILPQALKFPVTFHLQYYQSNTGGTVHKANTGYFEPFHDQAAHYYSSPIIDYGNAFDNSLTLFPSSSSSYTWTIYDYSFYVHINGEATGFSGSYVLIPGSSYYVSSGGVIVGLRLLSSLTSSDTNATIDFMDGSQAYLMPSVSYVWPEQSSGKGYGIRVSFSYHGDKPIKTVGYYTAPRGSSAATLRDNIAFFGDMDMVYDTASAGGGAIDFTPLTDWLGNTLIYHSLEPFFKSVLQYSSQWTPWFQAMNANLASINSTLSGLSSAFSSYSSAFDAYVARHQSDMGTNNSLLWDIRSALQKVAANTDLLPSSLETAQEKVYEKVTGVSDVIVDLIDKGNLFPGSGKDKEKDSVTQAAESVSKITDALGTSEMDIDVDQSVNDAFGFLDVGDYDGQPTGPLAWFSDYTASWFDGPPTTYSGEPMDFEAYMEWYEAQVALRYQSTYSDEDEDGGEE